MEQYEGKIIRVISCNGDETEGFVVGCDYDIGVTVVNNDDKDEHLYCLKGPSSYSHLYTEDCNYAWYDDVFENIIEMFRRGFFDVNIIVEISRKFAEPHGGKPSSNTCAFNK